MDHRLQRIAGLASLVLGVSLVCHAALAATQAGAAAVEVQPSPGRFLFWTPAEQRFGYRNMERIFPTHVVSRGTAAVSELPRAKDEPAVNFVDNGRSVDTATFMRDTNVEGLLVIDHGRVLLERYGPDLTANDRWTSWSVAKSITSTLLGAAIQEGFIHSIEDPVTRYLPELSGCCLSMTLEDFGRFGLFFMNGGRAGGQQVLPANWVSEATTGLFGAIRQILATASSRGSARTRRIRPSVSSARPCTSTRVMNCW